MASGEAGPRKLFMMGFATNVLNPQIAVDCRRAVLYLSLLPHFIDARHGSVLGESLAVGFLQIAVSISVNALVAMTAGSIVRFLARRPSWLAMQRWMIGTVLTGLAVRMAMEEHR